ncbi:MAG: hypothetical protein KGJ27_11015 [candidate division NC10 bacterium]|nr:hypothetical protein [candidate division NC10 bacterium]
MDAFKSVEVFLNTQQLHAKLSGIVLPMLAGLDFDQIRATRRSNWNLLKSLLSGQAEALVRDLSEDEVPLGYVVCAPDRDRLRERLATKRICSPIHWLLPPEVSRQRFSEATQLASRSLTLPIDERYRADHMVRLAEAVRTAL